MSLYASVVVSVFIWLAIVVCYIILIATYIDHRKRKRRIARAQINWRKYHVLEVWPRSRCGVEDYLLALSVPEYLDVPDSTVRYHDEELHGYVTHQYKCPDCMKTITPLERLAAADM